jgi:hypothetical protein
MNPNQVVLPPPRVVKKNLPARGNEQQDAEEKKFLEILN